MRAMRCFRLFIAALILWLVLLPAYAAVSQRDAVYKPFGEVISITGSASNNLRFPGQYFQLEAGLHYNWHRHYDPTIGRYTQPDPLGFVDGASLYSYAKSAPGVYVDPTGQFVPLAVIGTAAASAVFGVALEYGMQYALHQIFNPCDKFVVDKTQLVIAGALSAITGGSLKAWQLANQARALAAGAEAAAITKQTISRKLPGADGGTSKQIIERLNGTTISRTHQVTKDGKIIHQHQNHVGKYGGERQFPDAWTGTKTINAPYENYPPSFGPRQ